MEKCLKDLFPILEIEQNCIISKQGDITIAYKMTLPEIFCLSDSEYEAFHQAWIKAIKLLPEHTVLHKQDWFTQTKYAADFKKPDHTFLSRSSEAFFNERPYLDHKCYLYITRKPQGRKPATSMFSNLLRPSVVPAKTLDPVFIQEFLDACGQFRQIMEDSSFVKMERLSEEDLWSSEKKIGLLEQYCFLNDNNRKVIRDIEFKDTLHIGGQHCQLFTLGSAEELPSFCGSRINYDKYSSNRTKFSVGFSSSLGQLLPCNHIFNQYVFIEDAVQTIKKLESKRLRLQSLSAYSRENLISRDATNDFLNEAIAQQRLPVKAHFNILIWTDEQSRLKDLKNMVSSALAQMDAVAKEETVGAAQIFWAGIPGNAADFPMNDTFDTFAAQAVCFFNQETGYKDSPSPFGLRLGDRLTGKPVHVDISDWPMTAGITTSRNKFLLGPSGACRAIFN